jgi:hypothetical protein
MFTIITKASTLHLNQGDHSQGSHKEKNRNMGFKFVFDPNFELSIYERR